VSTEIILYSRRLYQLVAVVAERETVPVPITRHSMETLVVLVAAHRWETTALNKLADWEQRIRATRVVPGSSATIDMVAVVERAQSEEMPLLVDNLEMAGMALHRRLLAHQ
jgi:predicted chitinase